MNNVLPPDDDTKTVKFLLKENLARYKLNNKGKKLKTLIIDGNYWLCHRKKQVHFSILCEVLKSSPGRPSLLGNQSGYQSTSCEKVIMK